jgi:hypothetical protein
VERGGDRVSGKTGGRETGNLRENAKDADWCM